jgi:hypothetical protein
VRRSTVVEWKDYITLLVAVVGATLGVVNFALRLRDDRVRLKVIPTLAFMHGTTILSSSTRGNLMKYAERYGPPSIGIEVVNLSKFPVVISEVGLLESGFLTPDVRAVLVTPLLPHGDKWPKRLEPRESVSTYFEVDVSRDYKFTSTTRAYATTACNVTKVGTSSALKEWTEVLRAAQLAAHKAV